MAHKTLVGGTAYEITGGKALVDGTVYSIKNGKTLVGGTAYEVGFEERVTITINGGSTAMYSFATVEIDGFLYGGSYWVGSNFIPVCDNVQVVVPVGTVITCEVLAHHGDDASVKVNDNTVYSFTGKNEASFQRGVYEYTVVSNANIELIASSADGGQILITDDNYVPMYDVVLTRISPLAEMWINGAQINQIGTMQLPHGTTINFLARGGVLREIMFNGKQVGTNIASNETLYVHTLTSSITVELNELGDNGTIVITEI